MANRRVVITGIGIISSIGIGRETFWENLIKGKSGISEVESFDTSKYENHRGGEVKDFEPEKYMPKSLIKDIGRASQFSIAATKMALEDGELNASQLLRDRIAIMIGTTMGEGGMIEEIDKHWTALGEDDVWALTITKYPSNAISDNVSRFFRLEGRSGVVPTACSGGNYAIGYGYDLIRRDVIDYAIVGGSDPFSRIAFTGFNRLFAVAPERCQPFDKNRKGMMVGEGAGILLLEALDNAVKRKTNIYAQILGYGLSCDAHHMTAPSVEAIVQVMKKAIKNSGVDIGDVDYISAHGTGTPSNDKAECAAVKEVFKDKYKEIPISSIKSMLGHTMGAASAIEAIACCLAIKENIIPPTINYETPDPECDIDCVPNEARIKNIHIALNNSLAFGGNDACLALERYER